MECTNFGHERTLEDIFITYIFEFFTVFSLHFHYVHGCDRKHDFAHFHGFIHISFHQPINVY